MVSTVSRPQWGPVFRKRQGPTDSQFIGWKFLIIPTLLWLGVFYLYPIIRILGLSFTEFTGDEVSGLDNYFWFFSIEANRVVLWRTFWISGLIALLCLLVGYPYAYMLSITTGWRKLLLLSAVIIPLTTSPVVRSFAWIGILRHNGPIVSVLERFGMEVELMRNLLGATIGMVHLTFPFMVLPLYASLVRINRRLLSAGASLGAPPRTAFWMIYAPLSLPGVLAGIVLVFTISLGFYLTPALLGSQRETLLSPLIVTQTQLVLAWGRAGAMAMILLVLTLTILAIGALITRRTLSRSTFQ